MQKINAIIAIAQNLNDLIIDTVPASLTGSSIQAAEFVYPNSRQLQGKYFYAYSGAAAGQARVIGSLNTTTKEITFSQTFVSTPSVNTNFILTDFYRKSQYDNAVNRFIGKASTKFLLDKVATLSLVASQYEYAVPTGMEWINTLRLVPSANTDYQNSDYVARIFEFPPRYWRIEVNANGSYIIVIDPRKIDLTSFDNHWLNVEGQVKPDVAATDNGTIPADLEEYIIAGASMLLASQRIDESTQWKAKYSMFKNELQPLEDYVFHYGRGRKVRT